jgi:HK97 family phage prohead protease
VTSAIRHKESFKPSAFGEPLEWKFASEAGEITGYGAIFGNVDRQNDMLVKGAFAASLAEHKAEGTRPVMLWSHDPARVVGTWDDIREDATGLLVSGKLDLDTQGGREARSLLQKGALKGLSIGYASDPRQTDYDRNKGTRVLKAVTLYEVSLVSIPANPRAAVTAVKGFGGAGQIERALRELGFTQSRSKAMAGAAWRQYLKMESPAAGKSLLSRLEAAIVDLEKLKG